MMDLQTLRHEYQNIAFIEKDCQADPFLQFNIWLKQAINSACNEPNAMSLSTVDPSAQPSSRIVLLKEANDIGLTFFTSYSSRKGKDLTSNPKAALLFFWPELERQVRIEGKVEMVDELTSDQYFKSRPLQSQISAIISPQSQIIPNREFLLQKAKDLIPRFPESPNPESPNPESSNPESPNPRPKTWGGYRLKPNYFEFWQGRPNRLNDRLTYSRSEGLWVLKRLAP